MASTEPITSVVTNTSREVTSRVLQHALADLVQLHLAGKQAHWNVVGPSFRTVHLQLDELVASARSFADQIAERSAALGVPADGRAGTVAATSDVPEPDQGWLTDSEVVDFVVSALERTIHRLRAGIEETDKTDLVTQDLLIQATATLEKAHWMWQAQLATG
jgi:starvation-inducible DNA-binding protein